MKNECPSRSFQKDFDPDRHFEKHGDFTMTVFTNQIDNSEHFALVKPPVQANQVPLVRIHSECITGDVFGSCRCDCGSQLQQSLAMIAAEGGVLIYLRQEGRGIGLANKLKAYALQEEGLDTVEANLQLGFKGDERDYGIGAQILRKLGVNKMRLLSNNPTKRTGLVGYGLEIVENVAIEIESNIHNESYLRTKRDKMGHSLIMRGK